MKQIIAIIFNCLITSLLFAQSDSVYLHIDSKLISEIEILSPIGEHGIREKFTYFKSRYWIGKVDTVSMKIIKNIDTNESKKKEDEYTKYSSCDSIINKIRNSSKYWSIMSEIDSVATEKIGDDNTEFNRIKHLESSELAYFHEKCPAKYETDLSELQNRLLQEIERIKEVKLKRYLALKSKPELIDSNSTNSFLETFNLCETDLKTLEIIIISNPSVFISSIEKLSDTDFFRLTLKLSEFDQSANILDMKKVLKESNEKSRRKTKVVRKIGKREIKK